MYLTLTFGNPSNHFLLFSTCISWRNLYLDNALDLPCLHLDLQHSILTSVTYPWFQTPSLTSYIVSDTQNWGLPLCQCVTSVRLNPVLEYLCMSGLISVSPSQSHISFLSTSMIHIPGWWLPRGHDQVLYHMINQYIDQLEPHVLDHQGAYMHVSLECPTTQYL